MNRDRRLFFDAAEERDWSWFRIRFADFFTERLGDDNRDLLRWLLLHIVVQAGTGHIRTDLRSLEGEMDRWLRDDMGALPRGLAPGLPAQVAAAVEGLIRKNPRLFGCLASDETPVEDIPTPRPPLLVSADRRYAYLFRRRRQEDRLLASLEALLVDDPPGSFPLPVNRNGATDAVITLADSLNQGRRILLLSGGPGTGKTTTVISLLELLEAGRLENGQGRLTVALSAPTGRAAARLAEHAPYAGSTLHSLIRRSERRPLDEDIVVVDEASMIDLPMMNRLLDALPSGGRLLVVGDPDQLPSVDIGALMGDLLRGASQPESRLIKNVVILDRVYRSETTVLEAAAAIRSGERRSLDDAAVDGTGESGVIIRDLPELGVLTRAVATAYHAELDGLAEPEEIFAAFGRFTVLSPLRRGPYGITALNERVRTALGNDGILPEFTPVVITGNDADRGVFNGDRGILFEKGPRRRILVPDGEDFREFPPSVLPGWEPAWVQTIHKSQGSEFDHIAILLPSGAGRLLTREILYTAVTRARRRVELWADEEALKRALRNRVVRNSRIRDWAALPRDHSASG